MRIRGKFFLLERIKIAMGKMAYPLFAKGQKESEKAAYDYMCGTVG